jgi:hypothetical protein
MLALPSLLDALPIRDTYLVDHCRRQVDARTIRYPVGSGEAEMIALLGGLRRLVRQRLRAPDIERIRAFAARRGLHVGVAPGFWAEGKGGEDQCLDGKAAQAFDAYRTVFIGRAPHDVAAGIELDRGNDLELGRLLGYPRCCVEAFVSAPQPRRNMDLLAATAGRTDGLLLARLNVADLHVFHYVSWTPCSFACSWSARYADRIAALLDKRHADFRRRIDDALGAHRLVLHDDVQISMRGEHDGTEVRVADAWPTACDRHPDAHLDQDATEAVARLLALVRTGTTVSVRGNTLRVDAEVLALPVTPLLLPFGHRAR